MGKVRLNSEYIAFDPDTIFIDGANIPEDKVIEQDEFMEDSQQFSDEENKDEPMSGTQENK